MPVPGSRRRGPERLLVGGFEVTPHGLFIGAVIGGLVAAAALLCIFHFTKPKPKKRKPVLAVDFDEVCVGYLAAFIEFNNETYGTTLVFAGISGLMVIHPLFLSTLRRNRKTVGSLFRSTK